VSRKLYLVPGWVIGLRAFSHPAQFCGLRRTPVRWEEIYGFLIRKSVATNFSQLMWTKAS